MIDVSFGEFDSVDALSDWVELSVAIEGEVTKSELNHFLTNNEMSEEDSENMINFVWVELNTRMSRYSDDYQPYEIDNFEVTSKIDWKEFPEYILMLILSLKGNGWEPQKTGKIFERICNEAVRNYIGGESLINGFPKTYSVKQIADIIKEKFREEKRATDKDRGVDLIVWKSFEPNRGNKVLLFIQCAAGQNWKTKTSDLSIPVWARYIDFRCHPIRGLAIPVCLTHQIDFAEYSAEAGLIFDRTRIYRNTVNQDIKDDNLRNEILIWCSDRLLNLIAA